MTSRLRLRSVIAMALTAGAALVVTTLPASAQPAHKARLSGVTAVTTAPGIAKTLINAGIVPLPVFPKTSFRVTAPGGDLALTYGFPITGGNPNLSGPSGDIFHKGGILFAGKHKSLEVGKFDIDLAAGKIYANQVNFQIGHIAVLDLDLSKLQVSTRHGRTTLAGIVLRLDPAAAGAINSTFGVALPIDGSLVFGTATVTIRG